MENFLHSDRPNPLNDELNIIIMKYQNKMINIKNKVMRTNLYEKRREKMEEFAHSIHFGKEEGKICEDLDSQISEIQYES